MGILWPRLQTPTILANLSNKRSLSFADLCSGMPFFSWCYWSQDRANRAFCCGGRTESWTDRHSALWSKLLVFLFLWGHLFCLTHTAGDWRLHAHTHKADSTCLGRHNEAHNHSHGRWDTKELYQEGLSPLHPPAHPHTDESACTQKTHYESTHSATTSDCCHKMTKGKERRREKALKCMWEYIKVEFFFSK